jgi:hypothetical protein
VAHYGKYLPVHGAPDSRKKREIFEKKRIGAKSARAKHEEITSKNSWWGVIRVCGLTISVVVPLSIGVGANAPLCKTSKEKQCDREGVRRFARSRGGEALSSQSNN